MLRLPPYPALIIDMPTRISQAIDCLKVGADRLCTRVHGAGLVPNVMDRFMFSNLHEVLFVN
jgi:hypothetical protein